MTNEELCKALRKPWFINGCEKYQLEAADQIEALVKERDAAMAKHFGAERVCDLLDNKRRDAEARAEAAEAALKDAVETVSRLLNAVDAYAETAPQSCEEAIASGDVATSAEVARAFLSKHQVSAEQNGSQT